MDAPNLNAGRGGVSDDQKRIGYDASDIRGVYLGSYHTRTDAVRSSPGDGGVR